MSQPAPVGHWFVFYAAPTGSLQVIALNASDGSTAWTTPATPSNVTAGVYADLAVSGGTVYYLQGVAPARYGGARVVARDVASNKIVWKSPDGFFMTWPEICPDQSTAICVNGAIGSDHGQLRFSAATGQLLATVTMGKELVPGRELGSDLFDPGGRSSEKLIAVSKGKAAWTRRLSKIFTLPNASTDGGWDFGLYPNGDLYVGSVGVRPHIRDGKATAKLGQSQTAGFVVATGRVVWRTRGFYSCAQPLPCPRESEAGYTSPGSVSAASIGIRFIETGTAVYYRNGSPATFSRDATVSIQGFDPKTGRTRWTYRAGRNLSVLQERSVPPRRSATTIVLGTRTGEVELHLTSGRTTRVHASAHAWCRHLILYHLNHAAYYQGGRGIYVGQQALFSCTADAKRSSTPPVIPAFIRGIGATTDGMTAWTDTKAVHGAPN